MVDAVPGWETVREPDTGSVVQRPNHLRSLGATAEKQARPWAEPRSSKTFRRISGSEVRHPDHAEESGFFCGFCEKNNLASAKIIIVCSLPISGAGLVWTLVIIGIVLY